MFYILTKDYALQGVIASIGRVFSERHPSVKLQTRRVGGGDARFVKDYFLRL